MPSIVANNIRLQYVEQGTGDEAIVFVHGFAMSSGAWKEVLALLPKEYHAYAVDQRGFGQSEKPVRYELAQFAEDVFSFSRELGIKRFTYVGHSMAGLIGIKLALTHADVLKGMALVAPAPAHWFEMTDDVMAMMQSMGMSDMQTAIKSMTGSAEGIQAFIPMMFAKPPTEERIKEFISDAMQMDMGAIDGCWAWITSPNLEEQLAEIKVPTLIVAAGKDMIPVDALRRTASGIKGCQLEVFEDNGHTLFVESPERFVELLTDFIKRVSQA